MTEKRDVAGEPETAAIWHRHRKPPPDPARAGDVTCLRCDVRFHSWDRVLNRLCKACSGRKG